MMLSNNRRILHDGNFYILPFNNNFQEKYEVMNNKILRQMTHKIMIIWSSVSLTRYSEKYSNMRPPDKLDFTIGIPISHTKANNFGYDYLKREGWYVGNFEICSKYFIDFEIDELKRLIQSIQLKLINKVITLENCNNNSDCYFGNNIGDIIKQIKLRAESICNEFKPYIQKKKRAEIVAGDIFIKFTDYNNKSILDKLINIDRQTIPPAPINTMV